MEKLIETLNKLNAQVVQLAGQGNIKQAIIVAQQAVILGESQQLIEHPVYCNSLNNLAELHRIQGHYSQAQPLYLKALNIRKQLLGSDHPDVAQSLNNLAALYHTQGNYSAAEKLYLEALELWKVCYGDEDFEIATTLNNLGEIYREQGLYLKAEQVHLEALAMRKSLFGNAHTDIAQSLTNLGTLYISIGCYADAEKMHLEALSMKIQLLGEEHFDIASSLNNLGKVYDNQGRYAEAEIQFFKALEICQNILGNEHPHIASILCNIAGVEQHKGNYLAAEQKCLEVLAMNQRWLGYEHPDVAYSLDNLAEVYLSQGKYLAAEQQYQEAYSLRKRLFGGEHPDIAKSLSNLGVVFTYQGRYQEAQQQYLQALPMLERLLGKEHRSTANLLNNMAALYEAQGNYSQAEQKYLQVLENQKNILGNEHPEMADTLNQIAALYRLQGRYLESEQVHLECLEMRKRLLGERHPFIGASLNNLATLYHDLNRYQESESLLLTALEIAKNALGNEHPHLASTMSNLAVTYDFLGRYHEAEQLQLETLQLKRLLLGENHVEIAHSLNNLGELYFSLGRYQEAEQRYLESLAMRKALFGEEHPKVAFSLNNLATLFAATHRPEEALVYRVQASKINERLIQNIFAFSSESDRLSFLDKIRNDFDLFVSLVCNHLADSEDAKLTVFLFVLKRKGLTASALAAQNAAFYNGRYPQLTEKFHQLRDLSNQIIQITFAIPDTDDLATNQENLRQLQTRHNNLQKQLAAAVPEIQLSEQLFDLQAIAAALPLDSILVEFVRFEVFDFQAIQAQGETQWHPARYLAFIFTAGKPDAVQMVDLGTATDIDRLIQAFRLQASDHTLPTLAWGKAPKLRVKSYNPTPAIELSQALLEPIRDLVKDCRHLIIAPDGNLNLVPFQVLPIDTTGSRLLMDEYTISYLGVGREILRPQVQLPASSTSTSLIIADPDFDLSGTGDLENNARLDVRSFQLSDQFTETGLLPAPGTRFLGESVAKKLPDAKLYLGAEALETRLTNSNCPRIMLIATHGLFQSDYEPQPVTKRRNLLSMEGLRTTKVENPMLRSGLALAGANTWLAGGTLPKAAGKGFVFAQDIANLDLSANELTVLSACDTARGDIKIGEGVFGLRRAFAVAGTQTLVMSLWSVPGKVTSLLMERFFDNLQSGMVRSEALHSGQNYIRKITVKQLRASTLGLEVLKELLAVKELSANSKIDCQEDDTPLEHPFYWGAWICQGNTDPLLN